MQNSLFKLFEHKCVLEVCVHIDPIMIKIHPVFFLNPYFSNQAALRFLSEWRSSAQAAPTIVDWQDCLILDPPWAKWAVNSLPDSGAGEDKMSQIKRLRHLLLDVIMNKAIIIYSWHLSHWRRRGLTYFRFEVNVPIPDLHKCIYVRPNHLWSSFIYRSEYKGFYESLQITFPNNVLVSQFRGWSLVCSIDIYT